MIYAALGYATIIAAFLICWSRGLPPPCNHSRSFRKMREEASHVDVPALSRPLLNTNFHASGDDR